MPRQGTHRNPYDANIIEFDILHHTLKMKYSGGGQQIFLDNLQRDYAAGLFQRIPSSEKHTLLRTKEGATIGYWIPAKDVEANVNLCTLRDLVSASSSTSVEPHKRGLFDVSFYTSWAAYNPEGLPKYSSDLYNRRKQGEAFVNATKSLWKEASSYMKELCPTQFRELRRARLPKGMKRLADLWTGFAMNAGSEEIPVQTEPHRDYKSVFYGKSCLYPFGNFTGGGLILWDLRAVLELKAGDLFLFEDHLLTHSNEPVQGERHSVVAFMHQRVLDWHYKRFEKRDKKKEKVKSDQKVFRAKQSKRKKEAEERKSKKEAEKRKRRRGLRKQKKQRHLKR